MADNRHGRQTEYMHGSAARRIDVRTAIEGRPTRENLSIIDGEKKRADRSRMSFVYVLFLAAAILFVGNSLIKYINLQTEITTLSREISSKESELNNKMLENDDRYSKMVDAIDLDEIRRIAIEELGMVYASSDQIIVYDSQGSDYVRQISGLSN